MTAHPGPMPQPARITQALDRIGAHGPWVDVALGGVEPMVDDWEAGNSVPTPAQVEALAALTRMPVAFFYDQAEAGTTRMYLCDRSRRSENALTIIDTTIGWDGVQHTTVVLEPRSPRRPPAKPRPAAPPAESFTDRHRPDPDPDNAGCCRCGLPVGARNVRHLR